jgi:hypothetical protein
MFKKVVISTLISSTILFAESGVGLNINEEDLEIEAVLDSRNLAALQTSSTIYQADVNFLNENEENKLIGIGIGATNKVEGVEGLEMTLGVKGIWAELEDEDFTALPLMGSIRYAFPPLMYNIPPVSLEGKVLYAPKVLSFGSSEMYREFRVGAAIEVIENTSIYAGYRNIHTKHDKVNSELFNNSFYGGIKINY